MTNIKRNLRVAFAIVVMGGFVALPAAAGSPPRVAKDTSYAKARKTLLGLGYAPVTNPDRGKCDPKEDARCFPEQVNCAGSGLGQCIFAWRKGDSRVEVVTIGEMPIVDIVR